MEPLDYAAELGVITTDESTQLIAWKNYRVLLSRVDIDAAPDIEWSGMPSKN